MMRRKITEKLRSRVAIVGGVAFMAIAATVVGTNLLSSKDIKDDNQNLVDLNELPDQAQATEEDQKVNTSTGENIQANNYSSEQFGMDNVMDATDEYIPPKEAAATEELDKVAANETPKEDTNTEKDAVTETTTKSTSTKALNFQPENKMVWPISGNVLINYSMDSTVYFATLNQYKYNAALVIQGDVNTKVVSATDGIVEEVYTDEETGISMKVDLGNGYKAVYGQLKEITAKKGESISKGSVIGYISEPTKYYSIEGSNLYFKVMKDDKPINPLNFLE